MNKARVCVLLLFMGGILLPLAGCGEGSGSRYPTSSHHEIYQGYYYRPPYYCDPGDWDDHHPPPEEAPDQPGKPPQKPPHGPVTIQPVPKRQPRAPAMVGRPRPAIRRRAR